MRIDVHPATPLVGQERLTKYGGVLERLPDLRICFAHGGGAFPFTLPRPTRARACASSSRSSARRAS